MRNRMARHWSMSIIYFRNDESIPSNETEDEEVEEDIYYHDNWESCKIYQWNNQRKRQFTVYLALHVSYIMGEKMVSYIFPRLILGNLCITTFSHSRVWNLDTEFSDFEVNPQFLLHPISSKKFPKNKSFLKICFRNDPSCSPYVWGT